MTCIDNIQSLQKCCAEWQHILRLDHWDIYVGIQRKTAFEHDEAQGEISYNYATGDAIIKILDPIDWPTTCVNQDMEKTLVHELLHLQFAPCEPPESDHLQCLLWERSIESTAIAMIRLKRQNLFTTDPAQPTPVSQLPNKS